MKRLFKILKKMLLALSLLLLLLCAAVFLFVQFYPAFGGRATEAQRASYRQSGHFEDGKFVNAVPTPMEMGVGKLMTILGDYWRGIPRHQPSAPVPVVPIAPEQVAQAPDSAMRLYWFGHSAFLLQLEGKNILLDPMFGPSPAPHPWLGGKRYGTLPLPIEQLPQIDAVLFSHDHYDHLDYPSVVQLKDKVGHFFVPLGVGAHLVAWGVAPERVHELNWHETASVGGLELACVPARHFSGRGLADRFATFWCSWAIRSPKHRLYFSGDSGYGPHFKEIGEVYGPFDLALMECGQYDARWSDIHMMPEESVQACLDVRAKAGMPIHWGAFTLGLHSWTDPIERFSAAARQAGLPFATPLIGEPFVLPALPDSAWWEQVP